MYPRVVEIEDLLQGVLYLTDFDILSSSRGAHNVCTGSVDLYRKLVNSW